MLKTVFGFNVLRFFVLTTTTILLSRMATPELIGTYVLLIAVIEFISSLNDLSLGQQVIQDKNKQAYLSEAFGIQILISLVTFSLVVFAGIMFFTEHIIFLLLMVFGKCFSIMFSIHSSVIYLEGKFAGEARISFFLTLASCLASLLVAIISDEIFFALAVLYFLPLLSSYVLSLQYKIVIKPSVSVKSFGYFFKEGKHLFGGNSFMRLKVHVERFLVSSFFGVGSLGVLVRAKTFTDTLPSLFFGSFRNIALTAAVGSSSPGDKKFNFLFLVGFFCSLALLVMLVFNANVVVTFLLGDGWGEAVQFIYPAALLALYDYIANFEKVALIAKSKNSMLTVISVCEFSILSLVMFFGFLAGASLLDVLFSASLLFAVGGCFFVLYLGSRNSLISLSFCLVIFSSLHHFFRY